MNVTCSHELSFVIIGYVCFVMFGSHHTVSFWIAGDSHEGNFDIRRCRDSSRPALWSIFHFFVLGWMVFVTRSIGERIVSMRSFVGSDLLCSCWTIEVHLRVMLLGRLIWLREKYLGGADWSESDVCWGRRTILLTLSLRFICVSVFLMIVFPTNMKRLFHGNFHLHTIAWFSHWGRKRDITTRSRWFLGSAHLKFFGKAFCEGS